MDIEKLQEFLLWCMIINIGIYLLVVVAWLSMRDFYIKLLNKSLDLDAEAIRAGVFTYLGNYKLLITVFNFVPWLAILIIK